MSEVALKNNPLNYYLIANEKVEANTIWVRDVKFAIAEWNGLTWEAEHLSADVSNVCNDFQCIWISQITVELVLNLTFLRTL